VPHSFLRSSKAAIFDLDGVLVDSYECWFRLLEDAMHEQGKVPVSRDEFDKRWGQGPEADREAFFPEWTLEELMRFYDRRFPEYTKFSKCEAGSMFILEKLREQRKRIAIASNSPILVVNDLLEHAGLRSYPHLVIGVDQVVQGKPEPDLLFRALELFQFRRDEVFYVGDSIYDAKAAEAAGIFFVGYKRTGDISVQSFEELVSFL
jgi:phosphoglycolate phosphatase